MAGFTTRSQESLLLIGNNINNRSTINDAFNPMTGQFVGAIPDPSGQNTMIEQLWGLDFGESKRRAVTSTVPYSGSRQPQAVHWTALFPIIGAAYSLS